MSTRTTARACTGKKRHATKAEAQEHLWRLVHAGAAKSGVERVQVPPRPDTFSRWSRREAPVSVNRHATTTGGTEAARGDRSTSTNGVGLSETAPPQSAAPRSVCALHRGLRTLPAPTLEASLT